MIIDFTIENYCSFHERATLSLIAVPRLKDDPDRDEANLVPISKRLSLLRTAAIYGANASGKSNLARGYLLFRKAVLGSDDSDFDFDLQPFLLSTTAPTKPTQLEMRFLLGTVPYRYGFAVAEGKVTGEWLYVSGTARETMLFERTDHIVNRGRRFTEGTPFLEGKTITQPRALFLTLCSKGRRGDTAKAIIQYVQEHLQAILGLNEKPLRNFTIECLEKGQYLLNVAALLREADPAMTGIRLASPQEINPEFSNSDELPTRLREALEQEVIRDLRLRSKYSVFDEEGNSRDTVQLSFSLTASQGTQKLFAFAGPIFDTLQKGACLFVDELDAKLHPILTRAVIGLFQNQTTNPNGAQLLFITHDTNLLNSCNLRRDQIWFTEKDRYGASHLYSLAEFKETDRKNPDLEQDYIDGRFGAIPFLGDWSQLLKSTEGST